VLYLQKGQWQGKQVLPAEWVEKSWGKYSQLGSKQYGYFWWHQPFQVNGQTVEAQMATGNGGQKLYVLPGLDAVVVFTGGNYNSDRETPPNQLMPKYVLPALLAAKK
jgi:CubicO group peptidase (beta-lactamase class C family)